MLSYTRHKGCLLRITFTDLIGIGLMSFFELHSELQNITEKRVTELFTLFCCYGTLESTQDKVEAIYACFIDSALNEDELKQLKQFVRQAESNGSDGVDEIPLNFFSILVRNGVNTQEIMMLNEKELYVIFFSHIRKRQEEMIENKNIIQSAYLNLYGQKSEFLFEQKIIKTIEREEAQEAINIAPRGANLKMFERWN